MVKQFADKLSVLRLLVRLVLIVQMIPVAINAQVSFEYSYSTPNHEYIADAVQDSLGNYYLVGAIGTYNKNNPIQSTLSGLIIKLDAFGDTIMTSILPPPNLRLQLDQVLSLNDSIFIAIGSIRSSSLNDLQLFYLKFDLNLNPIVEKVFGSPDYNEYYSYLERDSNQLLVTGTAYDANSGDYQIVFYRIGLNGDSLFSGYYGIPSSVYNEFGYSVIKNNNDGNYIILGRQWDSIQSKMQPCFMLLDSLGSVDTIAFISNAYGGIYGKQLSPNSIVVFKSIYSGAGLLNYDFNLSKYDFSFNLIDTITYGIADTNDSGWYQSIAIAKNSMIIAGGISNWLDDPFPITSEKNYINIAKYDSSFQLVWNYLYSRGNDYLNLWKIISTNDDGVLILCTSYNTNISGVNENDIYVLKLDSLGKIFTGIANNGSSCPSIIIYPSPANDFISIKLPNSISIENAIITNNFGQVVLKIHMDDLAHLDISALSPGIYLLYISNAMGETYIQKFIKA